MLPIFSVFESGKHFALICLTTNQLLENRNYGWSIRSKCFVENSCRMSAEM